MDRPQDIGVEDLEGWVVVGTVEVGMDVVAAAEGSASMISLVLPLLATPMLERGLFVTVSEVMRGELLLFPWPAVLDGVGTEAPEKEHACWANCMASVQMSAISRCTRFGRLCVFALHL